MSPSCAYRLGSYEPIVEGTVATQFDGTYWHMSVRHRHQFGTWRDCELDVYRNLTWREMQDVLEATTCEWSILAAG